MASFNFHDIARIIAEVVHPDHFPASEGLTLEQEHVPEETIPWEIFRGRLLEPRFTREAQSFASWNIYERRGDRRSTEPLISVKLDWQAGAVHVVRGILSHVWVSDDTVTNVIETREMTRWLLELVGTIALADFSTLEALKAELASRIFQAVIGTSRLPLNSVEAPLPAFTLGELGYLSAGTKTPGLLAALVDPKTSHLEQTKLLELWLRSPNASASEFEITWRKAGKTTGDLLALLRNLFNEVSLSPYTDFVDATLNFLRDLVALGFLNVDDEVDFLGYLLRQVCRHLTAYDLITFHYRGANYPDALLLDAVLKRYLERIEQHPRLFEEDRIRRRALRQAVLLRHLYYELPVPDAPTSPGENTRVLPPPHPRVTEEQILNPGKRTRKLFAGEPIQDLLGDDVRRVLEQSVADLQHEIELRELGTAVFIDRPLGRGKLPGEPDQTHLLAHEAFSADIAKKRLGMLDQIAVNLSLSAEYSVLSTQDVRDDLDRLGTVGFSIREVLGPDRPIIALADAARVSGDFRVLRTLPRSAAEFLASFDFDTLRRRYDLTFLGAKRLLIVPVSSEVSHEPALAVFDADYRKRMEFVVNRELGFRVRGRNEYPVAGLTLTYVWDATGKLVDSPSECLRCF